MKGILIASFGSSYYDKAFTSFVEEVKREFAFPVEEGFSPDMMKHLERKGKPVNPSYEEAYNSLKEKADEVYALSLFVTSGIEYHKVKALGVPLSEPLLSEEAYYERLSNALSIKEEKDRALLLIGHGTSHAANGEYGKFFDKIKLPNVFMKTLHGKKTVDELHKEMHEYRRVRIIPLFLIAGDHVKNDLFAEDNSIASSFHLLGYEVEGEAKGLLEFEEIRKIFIEKLKKVVE